jgi:hypothetical protein
MRARAGQIAGSPTTITAAPGIRLTYKFAVAGESTSQSPCAGTNNSSSMVEVSGVTNFTASFETTFSQVSLAALLRHRQLERSRARFLRAERQPMPDPERLLTQGLSCIANGTVSTATASQNYPWL